MKYINRFRVAPGSKVKLKDIDPGFKDHHESHKEAAEEIEQDRKKLRELQELLYADGQVLPPDLPARDGRGGQGRDD